MSLFHAQFLAAKNAAPSLLSVSTKEKNNLLRAFAEKLEINIPQIGEENAKDISAVGLKNADRLLLTEERIRNIADETRGVANLPDSVGEVLLEKTMPNGLHISRVRVPLGVIGMIYESRPNVSVDAAVLALKSGNAIVLKGGKEALFSNRILTRLMRETLTEHGFSPELIQFLDTTERVATTEMLAARGLIDVLIPRGGRGLIDFVNKNAQIPTIETGASVVHTFVDKSADVAQAVAIVMNEKTRRTSVCNALDTVLVHTNIAEEFFRVFSAQITDFSRTTNRFLQLHADEETRYLLKKNIDEKNIFPACDEDYSTEWLSDCLSLKIVTNIDEALDHIREYSLGHSESICTEDAKNAEHFLREVDAACVYWNSSTAFSDGAQFGLGAEIGISTQKLHVRGPFALEGLTSTKWVIRGSGQVRK